jgi:hypothetical protein
MFILLIGVMAAKDELYEIVLNSDHIVTFKPDEKRLVGGQERATTKLMLVNGERPVIVCSYDDLLKCLDREVQMWPKHRDIETTMDLLNIQGPKK